MLHIPINEQGWGLIVRLVRSFARSDAGHKALGLALFLVVMLLVMNGLNITNSYVGRDFITAIAEHNLPSYVHQAIIYVGVLALSTVAAVLLRYLEERLGLLWRDWMTGRFVGRYLQYPTYYRISDAVMKTAGMEHLDQRIADDVRVFTTTALNFAVILINGIFTVVAFSGVLWTISPTLFAVALGYAVIGSLLTVALGFSLVDLNYTQLDKEAVFRSGIVHVRENAESIALLQHQGSWQRRLFRGFDDLVANNRRIIRVNRNLGFFTNAYNLLAQIIPVIFVAPLFISGEGVEFGVVTQSAMAFGTLIGAFSLIITQFQSISSFAAVIQRLVNLWYAIELAQTDTVSALNVAEDDDRVAYEGVTLFTATSSDILVGNLSISIPYGTRVLVLTANDATRDALFKATAGIGDTGRGRVVRPRHTQILFLPGRPYLPLGSLRDALLPEKPSEAPSDESIEALLRTLSLDAVLRNAGGLDVEHDWDALLSVREQQTIALARILLAAPRFAVLDLESADLASETTRRILQMLSAAGVSYLILARKGRDAVETLRDCCDAVLDLRPDGSWRWYESTADFVADAAARAPQTPAAAPADPS